MAQATEQPEKLTISGLRKAGLLLVAMGADASADILKLLDQDEVERLTWEIARIKSIPPDTMDAVVAEFRERLGGGDLGEQAGMDFVRRVLDRALGAEKSREIMARLGTRPSQRPFEALRALDPQQVFQFIQGEHPQTIALVISHLPPAAAAAVLSGLSPNVQSDVATRVATMDATSPDVVNHVEMAIMERLSTVDPQAMTSAGGATALVDILNQVDRATERTILEGLSEADPALADTIKEQMFVFEDITTLDSRTIQTILREVEQEDLRLALKGVGESVREVIFKNISERAAETLKEDIELMGPTRVRDVEASQKKIVGVIRRLEEAGEVVTRRSGDDDIIA